MRRMCSRLQRGALAALLVVAWSVPATAQTPVTLVHGLNSDQSTWGSTGWLTQNFYVTLYRPSLGSFDFYGTQALQLDSILGSQPSSLIAIGHSNGGIVSRVTNQQKAMQGVITIGTPHLAAPLAQNTLNGSTIYYLASWANALVDPLVFYAQYYFDDCGPPCPSIYTSIVVAANVAVNALYALGYLVENWGSQSLREQTVLGEMEPGSSFNIALNSGTNLAREASALNVRTSVVSEAPWWYTSMWVGTQPASAGSKTGWQSFVEGFFIDRYYYYTYYSYPSDPDEIEKRFNAIRWAWAATELSNTDYAWCNLMGGWQQNHCAGDGIVPVYSQLWPGRTATHTIANGPGHMLLTSHNDARAMLVTSLQGDGFSIPGAPPLPPGPLSASINGPSCVQAWQGSFWSGSASGGTGPYTYTWRVDGSPVGTGSNLSYQAPGSDFTLELVVTDQASGLGSTSLYVTVSPGPECSD